VTESPQACRQANELAIGVMARLCASLLGAAWKPVSVNFTHEALADQTCTGALFGLQACFQRALQRPGMLGRRLRCAPIPMPTRPWRAMRNVSSIRCKRKPSNPSCMRCARRSTYCCPWAALPSSRSPRHWALNVRTLQRRLEENEANFSDLINEVRRDLVQRYMQNPSYSLARIGELLGYSLPSSFTRWFTQQFGAAPGTWRSQHGKPFNSAS